MPKIDFTPNSAPLRGISRPSLEEVQAILRHPSKVAWASPDRPEETEANGAYFIWKIVCAVLLVPLGCLAFVLPAVGDLKSVGAPSRPEEAIIVPLSQAHANIYMVVRQPSEPLTKFLVQLAGKGIVVRLVTEKIITDPGTVKVTQVDPGRIKAESVLLDGVDFYPLGRGMSVR